MSLDTSISLTTIAAVKSFFGGKGFEANGMWVYYSGANATATVEVQDNAIVLTDAAPTTLDLTAAAYDTMTELVNYINASVAGWNAGLLCDGTVSSVDLVVTGSLDAKGTANERTLKIVQNLLLENLINRASDFINRYCNRILKTSAYTQEVYFGSGTNRLLLEQYPVTRVVRIGVGRANSFSILNTSTDANFCTVEITATVMRLIVDGGVNDDDTDLTLATYTDINALITAIHALGKGWSCSTLATDTATRDADELLIRPSMFVDATKRTYCETADDYITTYRVISPEEARNYGVIQKAGVFVWTTEYFVSYVAGYTTIPYALEDACVRLVKFRYDESSKDLTLKEETIGKVYSYVLADLEKALPTSLISELELFRKREF